MSGRKNRDFFEVVVGKIKFEEMSAIKVVLRKIENVVTTVNKKFFTTFARGSGIFTQPSGVAPSLPPASFKWPKLSKNWLKKKRREGRSLNHFVYKGGLKKAMAVLDARTVFGNPIASMRAGSGRGTLSVRLDAIDRAIARDMSGGRAKIADVANKRIFQIVVDPFPMLQMANDSDSRQISSVNIDDEHKVKLKGRKKTFRPTIGPYARWWRQAKLIRELERQL